MAKKSNDSVGFTLWKLTTLWQRNLADVLASYDITQTQFAILASMLAFEKAKEDVSQAILVADTNIDKMTISKSVRSLQAKKLVRIKKSKTDKRANNLELYAKGKTIAKEAVVAVRKADKKFFAGATQAQVETLKKIGDKVVDSHNEE